MSQRTGAPTQSMGEVSGVHLSYVVSQYPATNHTFILREILTLRKLGFAVDVVSIRPSDRTMADLSKEEAAEARLTYAVLAQGWLRILGISARTFLQHPSRFLAGLSYAFRLADWRIRQMPFYAAYFAEAVVAGDYLIHRGIRHAHTHFASTVTLLMTRVFPIEFSATLHGPDEFNDVAGFHMAEKVAQARMIATISRFATSQTMKASRPRDWDKIRTLYLGVDPGDFVPRPVPACSDTFRVLCVGRLAAAKAQHILIAAIGRIVALGHSQIRLTLVGDGPERVALQETAARHQVTPYVTFAGACNHDRVIEYYTQTHVFAMASFAEGVPVVLMEAMAMEIPCVATWVMGIPELIENEVNGLLVPPADVGALANALMRLMNDPSLAEHMGKAARQKVLADFDLSRNTEKLALAFQELTKDSGN